MLLTIRNRCHLSVVIALLFLLVGTTSASPFENGDQSQINTEARVHQFLINPQRGKEILAFVHFGSTYLNHQYLRSVAFDDGDFALYYEFKWRTTEDGYTDIGFICDPDGNIVKLVIIRTDAVFNRPFLLANLSIQTLGTWLLSQYKSETNPADRRILQELIDDADAKSLLEWTLKLEQRLGH